MWPRADVERVKAAVVAARAKGFDALVASVAGPVDRRHHWQLTVYDTRGMNREIPPTAADGALTRLPDPETNLFEGLVDLSPQPIAMMRDEMVREPEMVVLVIDAAGKVRSAKMAGGRGRSAAARVREGMEVIPAFKDGHAVACRTQMIISPLL
jgi:hypothetical protein